MQRNATIITKDLITGYVGKNGNVVVSENINETLYSGELTCLLGPNGAGKSTILKTLSAFIPPLGGDIEIEGKLLSEYKDSELAKVIGVVLTDRINLTNMTVEDLVGMGRSPYTGFWGTLSGRDREIVDEAISLVKVDNLKGRMVHTLSDGERQKVMIAKALAQETPVIFLDEPTAFLDYPSKVEILQLLQQLSRVKGKTVFLSTHDLEIALQIADKVWLVDKKLGIRTGTPEDLSLNGDMGNYFEREGVKFDLTTGLFKISWSHDRCVRLSGDGNRRKMMEKALARNGIAAVADGDNRVAVKIMPAGYSVNDTIYATIGESVCKVKALLDGDGE